MNTKFDVVGDKKAPGGPRLNPKGVWMETHCNSNGVNECVKLCRSDAWERCVKSVPKDDRLTTSDMLDQLFGSSDVFGPPNL